MTHQSGQRAKTLLSFGCSALAVVGSSSATAADTPATGGQGDSGDILRIEEIVVTAARLPSRLQDTALAVTVLDSKAVESAGVFDPKGLQTSVPGLNYSTSGADQFVYLRGIGSSVYGAFSDNSVATYIDGVYVPRQTSANQAFNDIRDIEVLRGPQATLYGRNATGGAILITTKDPTQTFESSADVQFGNYDTRRYRFAVSGPISQDVEARLSVVRASHEGYDTNLFDGSHYDSQDLWAVRGVVKWEVTDSTSITVRADYSRDTGATGAVKAIDPNSPQFSVLRAPFSTNPRASYDNLDNKNFEGADGVSVRLKSQFDGANLTVTSAYDRYDVGPTILDLDDSTVSLLEQLTDKIFTNAFYNDILLTSDWSQSRWNWLLGATYAVEQTRETIADRIPVLSPLPFGPIYPPAFEDATYRGRANSYAVYGQLGFALRDDLKLTAGLRYSSERKDGSDSFVTAIDFPRPIGPFVANSSASNTKAWPDFSPKFGVEYRPKSDLLIYANATQGFKSGAFDPQNVVNVASPETIWNYELGEKSEWFQRRLTFNATIFHYDYKNIQIFQGYINPATHALQTFLSNAARANVDGLELEALVKPMARLKIGANVSLLDGRYGANSKLADVANGSPVLQSVQGNQMVQAPRISANVFAEYDAPLGQLGNLDLYGEAFHQSARFFTPFEDPTLRASPYNVFNARLTFVPSGGNWHVALYGRNLSNALVVSDMARTLPLGTDVWYDAPRTFGIELGVNYK